MSNTVIDGIFDFIADTNNSHRWVTIFVISYIPYVDFSQLARLRGRVGRGAIASHCLLLYHAPLSITAQKRLGVLRDSNDGFVIAERDLEIRGPGEVLGTKQTGLAEFKIADLNRDKAVLNQVRPLAFTLMKSHPDMIEPLVRRWLGAKSELAMA